MKLCLVNHSFKYELEKLIRIFLPFEKIEFSNEMEKGENTALTILTEAYAKAYLYINSNEYKYEMPLDRNSQDNKKEAELKLALCLYECFVSASNYIPEWGILTGIRPAKLFSKFCKIMGEEKAEEYFKAYFKVNNNKISLCKQTHKSEEKIVSLSSEDSVSLYISIPFCPTRCTYCSFVSHSVENSKKLIPTYIEYLIKELQITADIIKRLNLRLETIYIGGGTPTSLSAEQLKTLMKCVKDNFNLENLKEYTVEAGRPDTVTEEKLSVIKEFGATRISINPQTMNDNVLSAIGRKHTAKQTLESFSLARNLGFTNINMDLIAGLPTDTFESFCETVENIIRLNPESVTVHSLSMKRSSSLTKQGLIFDNTAGETASKMVDFARQKLTENKIFPYYMYRQSKTIGNLENVGYSKKGKESLYNVFIMDETHSIFACGASAVTKLREVNGDYIERIFNYKYPYEYINQFDEICNRKKGIEEFYAKFGRRNQ